MCHTSQHTGFVKQERGTKCPLPAWTGKLFLAQKKIKQENLYIWEAKTAHTWTPWKSHVNIFIKPEEGTSAIQTI